MTSISAQWVRAEHAAKHAEKRLHAAEVNCALSGTPVPQTLVQEAATKRAMANGLLERFDGTSGPDGVPARPASLRAQREMAPILASARGESGAAAKPVRSIGARIPRAPRAPGIP